LEKRKSRLPSPDLFFNIRNCPKLNVRVNDDDYDNNDDNNDVDDMMMVRGYKCVRKISRKIYEA
jgi:hypothetical protein